MNRVCSIDISPFRTGNRSAESQVARAVDQACRETGFLIIEGHGVSLDLIDRMHRSSRALFDLPDAQKRGLAHNSGYLGYAGQGSEAASYSLDQESPSDIKEGYAIQRIYPPETAPSDNPHFLPELWPQALDGFEPLWREYFHAMEQLAAQLLRIFATSLDLPAGYFDGMITKASSFLRAINYPDHQTEPLPRQLRTGAHTDYGTVTMLTMNDAPGGLQIERPDGSWEDVSAPPGAFVVNLGDMMAQWTNDRWRSTMHRVANPPPQARGRSRRQSIAFFHFPDDDAIISPLSTCCTAERPAAYAPITSREHLMRKLSKQFEMKAASKSEAPSTDA